MLFTKNIISFNSFQKGWIPDTEVFPNGSPMDSALELINFDIDNIKGGLVKTNGYIEDDLEFKSSLTSHLANPSPDLPHQIKYIHNYSLGIPLKTDLLLAVAYNEDTTNKYKWLIRDNIVNDDLLSNNDIKKWHNLLLELSCKVTSCTNIDSLKTEITLDELDDYANEIIDANSFIIEDSLNGFILKYGNEYRVVTKTKEGNKIVVTPNIAISENAYIKLYRNLIQIDNDFNSIFNPSKEYSSFVVNNSMSKLMIGLGKEIKPLWIGYINKKYFYNKTNSLYLLDYNSKTCQNSLVLEKRIPEFSLDLDIDIDKQNGDILSGKEVDLGITASFDGYQEIVPDNVNTQFSSMPISLTMKINFCNFIWSMGVDISPVANILHSDLYLKLYIGDTLKAEIRFVAEKDWDIFSQQIDLSSQTNKIWIKVGDNLYNDYRDSNALAYKLVTVFRQDDVLGDTFYVGSFNFEHLIVQDFKPATNNNELPEIILGSDDSMYFEEDEEWSIITNQRIWNVFTFICSNFVQGDTYDTYYFDNGIYNYATENFFRLKIPYQYNAIKLLFKLNIAKVNRRISSFSVWGRYKPEDETVSKWLSPFYLVKKIYVNDTNNDDTESTNGWYYDVNNNLCYETIIKHIYGSEIETLNDSIELTTEQLKSLAGIKNIPQLLSTLKYEPTVKISAKYGASTIHNGVSYIADTDDNIEVLRFSRIGSTGTSNLDVFSYDFDSSIGYEFIGQDSPGHIMALASKDDELIVLRDNSLFSIKTDIETISIKKSSNYIGCKYPRSVVCCRYGLIFADDNGIWLYQGLVNGRIDIIQINWQWDNYYKNLENKNQMFASWNGKTEEYWIYIPDNTSGYSIYVADFKNMQEIDQSLTLVKEKEKVLIPWRKKIFNLSEIKDFTIDSYGNLVIANDSGIYYNIINEYSMNNLPYDKMIIETKYNTNYSPPIKIYEIYANTDKSEEENWKYNISLYVNNESTPRQTVVMLGNCKDQDYLYFTRPINIGNVINEIKLKVDMSENNGIGIKKLREFGLNIMARKEKYVSE